VGLLASFALLPCGVARAATVTSNFEPPAYALGPVLNQNGWLSDAPLDEAVVPNTTGVAAFGLQSWRLSNSTGTNNSFTGTQSYSPPVSPPAGEKLPDTVFIATFSFLDPAYQAGLHVTVSPDSGDGSRMSYVGLTDESDGTHVQFFDSSGPNGDFQSFDLPTLSFGTPHTIEFRIKLNPGPAKDQPSNDQVQMVIDGQPFDQCFTTWEQYYRNSSEQTPPPNSNMPPSIAVLQFRVAQAGGPVGGGYLFDNVTTTSGTGPTPPSPSCDVTIDKQADSGTVTAGGVEGYRITVRNRGRLSQNNLLACDHIPREATFVSADRKLRRIGRRRCLFISRLGPGQRVSFHIMLRVNANAPKGTLDNVTDVTPTPPPGSPAPPPVESADLPPGGATAPVTPVAKATAPVKVVAKKTAAPAPPPVTG
jgi:uncharacterized repeat protein (TIGR01451 family)